MANLSQNLSDNLRMFGTQPSTKWGSPMKWGTDLWGNGGNTSFNMPTRTMSFHNDTGPSFSDSSSANNLRCVNNDLVTFQQNGIGEYLRDGSGKYFYLLAGGVTNDENAFRPSYILSASASNSWTLQTTSSVTWSQS